MVIEWDCGTKQLDDEVDGRLQNKVDGLPNPDQSLVIGLDGITGNVRTYDILVRQCAAVVAVPFIPYRTVFSRFQQFSRGFWFLV